MANIFAPNGFVESYRLGGAPTEQPNKRYILNTNSTPIYFGDPVSASRLDRSYTLLRHSSQP